MKIHATIDLETLDTCPQSTVITLGGCKFNPHSSKEPYDELYLKISIDDQNRLSRTTSDDTINWWAKQDQSILEEALDQTNAITVDNCLTTLTKWLVGVDVIWAQGYGFDMTILEDMYRSAGRSIPWNFWQIRDSRTLFSCCAKDPRKSIQQNLHNALADAIYQSKAIQIAFSELNIKKNYY